MRYWYHPESESYLTTTDDEDYPNPHCVELSRGDYLRDVALEAIKNAISNGGLVPDSPRDAAAEMVEQGVFGTTEDCLDEGGGVRDEYVDAVRSAKRM